MYIIKKNNKKTVRRSFPSYEEARQYLRKILRKRLANDPNAELDFGTLRHRSPSIGDYGYSIAKA